MATTFQNANFIGTVKIRGDLDITGPTTETIFGGTIRCNSLYFAGDEISTVYAKLEMPTLTGLNVVGQTAGDPVIKIYPNYTGAHQSSYICINNTGVTDGSPNQLILGSVSTATSPNDFRGYAKIDTASNGVSSSTPLSICTQGIEHILISPENGVQFKTQVSSDNFVNAPTYRFKTDVTGNTYISWNSGYKSMDFVSYQGMYAWYYNYQNGTGNKSMTLSREGVLAGITGIDADISSSLSIRCQGSEHIRLEPASTTTSFMNTTITGTLYTKNIGIDDTCSLYAGLGIHCKPGAYGAYSGNVFNANWEQSALNFYIGTAKVATLTSTCDYRLKDNIETPKSVLDRLCSIPMFTYNYKNISIFRDNGKHIGYFAHELQNAFPELDNIVTGKKDEVDASGNMVIQTINAEFTHLLMKAIQEQNEIVLNVQKRIENLESCLHNSNN